MPCEASATSHSAAVEKLKRKVVEVSDFSGLVVPAVKANPRPGEDCRGGKFFENEAQARTLTDENAKIVDALQDKLYAEGKRALLVILQGMDTSGKDGTIRGVFNQTGPLGVAVTSFRQPSVEELAHDFLWRAHLACPRRGMIALYAPYVPKPRARASVGSLSPAGLPRPARPRA